MSLLYNPEFKVYYDEEGVLHKIPFDDDGTVAGSNMVPEKKVAKARKIDQIGNEFYAMMEAAVWINFDKVFSTYGSQWENSSEGMYQQRFNTWAANVEGSREPAPWTNEVRRCVHPWAPILWENEHPDLPNPTSFGVAFNLFQRVHPEFSSFEEEKAMEILKLVKDEVLVEEGRQTEAESGMNEVLSMIREGIDRNIFALHRRLLDEGRRGLTDMVARLAQYGRWASPAYKDLAEEFLDEKKIFRDEFGFPAFPPNGKEGEFIPGGPGKLPTKENMKQLKRRATLIAMNKKHKSHRKVRNIMVKPTLSPKLKGALLQKMMKRIVASKALNDIKRNTAAASKIKAKKDKKFARRAAKLKAQWESLPNAEPEVPVEIPVPERKPLKRLHKRHAKENQVPWRTRGHVSKPEKQNWKVKKSKFKRFLVRPNLNAKGKIVTLNKNTKWLREVQHYQRTTDLLIPRLPFRRFAIEVLQELFPHYRAGVDTTNAMQTAAEAYLVELIKFSYDCSLHAHRVTLQLADLRLAWYIYKKRPVPKEDPLEA